MRRLWLLLTLGVLLATASVVAFCRFGGPETTPMIPLVPALPATTSDPAAATGGAEPATAAASGSDRDPVPAPAVDARPTLLEVAVRQDGLGPVGAPPLAVPRWEVAVQVAATRDREAVRLAAETDGAGIARFAIPGGDGRTASVRCLGATAAEGTLQADGALRLELRISLRLLVRGTVVDAAGRGIADADLVLLPWTDQDHHPPRLRRVGRSGADGRFALALPTGGRLGAEHAAYAPSPMFAVEAGADPLAPPAATVVELALLTAPGGAVGRVVDSDGAAVAHAELEFCSAAPMPHGAVLAAPPQRVRSKPDGTFAVGKLRPGRIDFAVRAEGLGSGRGTTEVRAGETQRLEIVLPKACEVHGRVEDENGAPVAGCRVWSHALDAFDGASTVSGADGTFRLTGLPPGSVQLTARDGTAPLQLPTARRDQTRVDLLPGQVGHWVATLRLPATEGFLRGQVVDTDGARLPTWRVRVRTRAGTANAMTDSGGFFHVRPPGPGPVDVLVYAPGTPANAFARTVRNGVDPLAGPARIVVDRRQPWGRIHGLVQTATQEPVPATLTCWHHQRRELARFQAGADGAFRLDAVPPGTVDLHVEHPGHTTVTRRELDVTEAGTVDVGTIVLDPAAALHGTVVGPDGNAPAQLEVALLTPLQRLRGDYSAGTYRFPSAPPGRHVLQVQGEGVAADNFVVELEAGVELQRDMELRAGVPRRLEVSVPAAAGRIVSLALRQRDAAHTWYAANAVEPANGPVVVGFVAFMAPGTYEAIAWAGTDWEARATVRFTPGDDAAVRLELSPR